MRASADRFGHVPGSRASVRTLASPHSYLAARQLPSARTPEGREHSSLHPLSVELQDYLATDADGFIGVVDEVRADGTICIACGWFGRCEVLVSLVDVERVNGADRELVLRAGLPVVEQLRAESGIARRIVTRLLGRALTRT